MYAKRKCRQERRKEMPCRPSPRSLRQASLDAVAHNFESICYGAAKGTKELHRLIESDAITQYDSPFGEWPSSLLADLSDAIYRVVESDIFSNRNINYSYCTNPYLN